ncbi:MAG: ABC transporter permease subunit [Alphaproteobacteria bacterium]|nr:ABC transporter permease subunit [Alphaproteobacteria bacterium]
MRAVLTIAGREIREGIRDRWVLAATLLLAVLALALALLGSAPVGAVKASGLSVTVVSLASLSVYLVPLIALLLSYETVIGEIERGTLMLLLAYPVARWQIILGKFAGHAVILACAALVGFGGAGLAVAAIGSDWQAGAWLSFASMVASSVLLGAVFLGLGYLVSALARERGTAAGLAIAVWLVIVVLYDLALLGVLVLDEGQVIDASLLPYLLMLNPADSYRLVSLAGSEQVRVLSGLASVAPGQAFSPIVPLAMLFAWVAAPLALAAAVFQRREV